MKMEYSKSRSESSEYTWKANAILTNLENYFKARAQEVCERKSDGSRYAHYVVEREH